jgi:hypothetical protein
MSWIGRAVQHPVGDRRQQFHDQQGTQLANPALLGNDPLCGNLQPRSETCHRGDIKSAGADVSFLTAAVQHRRQRDLPATEERTDSVGTTELVGTDR